MDLKEVNELPDPLNGGSRLIDWIMVVVAIAGANHGATGDRRSGAVSSVQATGAGRRRGSVV